MWLAILVVILYIIFMLILLAGIIGMSLEEDIQAWMWIMVIVGALGWIVLSIILLFVPTRSSHASTKGYYKEDHNDTYLDYDENNICTHDETEIRTKCDQKSNKFPDAWCSLDIGTISKRCKKAYSK